MLLGGRWAAPTFTLSRGGGLTNLVIPTMREKSLLLVGLAAVTIVAQEVKVDVYEGPTDCLIAQTVKVGDLVGMHYTGTIDESSKTGEPGMKFDSSRDRGVILERTIGVGQLIQGWDEGLIGLCVGEKAILVIPPELGYGSSGAGEVIPGGATLKFDVEVISVTAPSPVPNLFDELDADQDGLLTPEEILAHFQRDDPNGEMPPGLMEKDDKDGDGVVSREEFGGPRMPWEMCLEMLLGPDARSAESPQLGLAVRWLCQRERGDSASGDGSTSDTEVQVEVGAHAETA